MTALAPAAFADLLQKAVSEPGTISKAYSAFHGYSIGNQVLALIQCAERGVTPGPIVVATFMGGRIKGGLRGAPARAIQELAGHKDLSTTQRYMHLSPAAIEGAIRLLDVAGSRAVGGGSGESESTETANSSR